jgi:hypothetical protein
MTPSPRQFTITLKARADGADPLRALKAVLKYAGRVHGLRWFLLTSEPHRQDAVTAADPQLEGQVAARRPCRTLEGYLGRA